MSKIRKLAPSAAKVLLFILLFSWIYDYTDDAFRGSNMHSALPILAERPDESYDVILAGSCHMQLSVQPAQLFAQNGIAACNIGSAAQSIPVSYFLIKEMIDRHSPELVVLDLFTLYETDLVAAHSWAHEALDGFPLSINKIKAINTLIGEGKENFYFNYRFYHSRWKELKKEDYRYETVMDELYQFSVDGIAAFPEPFSPVDPQETMEIPPVAKEYLEKIIQICKESGTSLLLTATPYRADATAETKEASEKTQKLFNSAAKLAAEHGVDYLNGLYYIDEMDLDFTQDFVDASHVNAIGTEKVTEFYGNYLRENYDLPDRSQDERYSDWHEECQEYWTVLRERQAICRQPKEETQAEVQE